VKNPAVINAFCYTGRFEFDDSDFREMIAHFDSIFYDINQGYAVDFIPWLSVFHRTHFRTLRGWSKRIREIILRQIVTEHENTLDVDDPRDFVDVLLTHLMGDVDGNVRRHQAENIRNKDGPSTAGNKHDSEDDEDESTPMDWQAALYELEDLIGGHSAIGNLFMRMAVYLERDPRIIEKIREEYDNVIATTGKPVTVDDRHLMPYTEAVMLETLRVISSPIVPHVATENTSIGGEYSRPPLNLVLVERTFRRT
jgi:cytochrome P450 family 307 subfamily A